MPHNRKKFNRIFMNTGTSDNSQGCELESKQRKIHY